MPERFRSPLVGYTVAALAVLIAVLLRIPLQAILGDTTPFLFFFPAIVFSGWAGGLRSGLLATGLSAFAALFLFIEPYFSLSHSVRDIINISFFLVAGTFISLVCEAWHKASRRAEDAGESERRQRDLFQITLSSIGDAVIATDSEGRITFMNPVAQSLTAWKFEEAEGRPLTEVFNIEHELTHQKVEDPVTKVLRLGTTVGLANHTVLIAKDGREIPIDDSGAPIRNLKGDIIGVVLVFRDITERRQAEQSRAFLTAIVESSDSAIIGKKLDGTIVSWNRGAEKLYGYSSDEVVGQPISILIPPNFPDELPQIMERLKRGEAIDSYETIRRGKDGRLTDILLTVSPIHDDEGNMIGASAIARDITERKRAEQMNLHLAAIVESSDDAIISKSLEGTILSWNKGAERIFGYLAEEVIGKSIYILIPPERAYEEPKILERLRGGERIDHYETVRVTKAGRAVNVSLTVSPIKDKSGRIIAASKIARDITENKQMEREREQSLAREQEARKEAEAASRAKDEFLATISHELRTPLNAIMGWIGMLRGGRLDDATKARALETLDRNARLQAQLIEDMLEVSRIVTGKLRLDVQPVELASVIQLAVDAIRPAADAKGVRLQILLDPNAGPVSGDPGRLQQVVWNLLSNGVKFTPKGGRVQIRLERMDSHVQITVSDTGQGINSEFLPHVFERFRQADSSLSRKYGGLGLGLAIVRHLVELHGGAVEAMSDGEGQGSTFQVKLPVLIVHSRQAPKIRAGIEATDSERPLSDESLPSLTGLRLLVIEDEADARELAIMMLRQCGADARAFTSVAEALVALGEWKPDVLISDIEIPGEDGYSFIRKVRSSPSDSIRDTPAIALTAHVRGEDRIKALSEGFDAHVAKPVDLAELATVILSLARRSKSESPV